LEVAGIPETCWVASAIGSGPGFFVLELQAPSVRMVALAPAANKNSRLDNSWLWFIATLLIRAKSPTVIAASYRLSGNYNENEDIIKNAPMVGTVYRHSPCE
jgi:hypothetical protein